MAWAAIGGAVVGVVGNYVMNSGNNSAATVGANAQQYDPFQSYRPQYGTQLNSLMANPQSVTKMPGYKFQQQQGEQAVTRAMAAQGKNLSGNEMFALQQQGQGLASDFYNKQLATQMQLSGAAQNPATGYNAGVNGSQNYMQNMTGLVGVGTQLGTAFGNWVNSNNANNTSNINPSGATQDMTGFQTNTQFVPTAPKQY